MSDESFDPAVQSAVSYHKLPIQSRKCKIVKRQMFTKMKKDKNKRKKKLKKANEELRKALGDAASPKATPHTLESLRPTDLTTVDAQDEEVIKDKQMDDFKKYFSCDVAPRVLVTTNKKSSLETRKFLDELVNVIPNSQYVKRGKCDMKDLVQQSVEREFTDMIVINEAAKKPNSIIICHLPKGPTATFRLTSIKLKKALKRHGNATSHRPEVILNNFNTRLGHSVGRMIGSLFHFDPQFKGRNCVTFHNQRDFIFFRRHRYVFKNGARVGLQELGPRFTLKLRRLQKGTFDTSSAEYEWFYNHKQMDINRRTFFL